jgi:hypothetical protein
MSTHSSHQKFAAVRSPRTLSEPAAGSPAPAFSSPASQALLWVFLVAVAVAGRTWQPVANVTPLAAVSLAAGAAFPGMLVAASVPLAALVISGLYLPSYGSLTLAAVVYAALAWPVVLGRLGLLGRPGQPIRWLAVAGGALASSLVFFFATNTAHWLLTDQYSHTAGGLVACLVAGLPFHRWMPVGDVAWSLALFGCLSGAAAVGGMLLGPRLAVARLPQGRGDSPA